MIRTQPRWFIFTFLMNFSSTNWNTSHTFQVHSYNINVQHIVVVTNQIYVVLNNIKQHINYFKQWFTQATMIEIVKPFRKTPQRQVLKENCCVWKKPKIVTLTVILMNAMAELPKLAFAGCTSTRQLSSNVRARWTVIWSHHSPKMSESTSCHRPSPNTLEIWTRTARIQCETEKLHSRSICDISMAGTRYKSHKRRNKTAKVKRSAKASRVFTKWARVLDWLWSTWQPFDLSLILIFIAISGSVLLELYQLDDLSRSTKWLNHQFH